VTELGRRWDITQSQAAGIVHDNLASLYAATVGTSTPSPQG
jgi:hypothetical protein